MKKVVLIKSKLMPIILGLFFGVIYYILLIKYFNKKPSLENYNFKALYLKYTLYTPIIFGLFTIVFSYILFVLRFILRLKWTIFYVIIYFIVFLIPLILGIDLYYFEAHDAPLINLINSTFSLPLIISSICTLMLVLILSLFKVGKSG